MEFDINNPKCDVKKVFSAFYNWFTDKWKIPESKFYFPDRSMRFFIYSELEYEDCVDPTDVAGKLLAAWLEAGLVKPHSPEYFVAEKRRKEVAMKYVQIELILDGREGNEMHYAPLSICKELAKKLKKDDPDDDVMDWFRNLITWNGKPTKKHPVVGAGVKGAAIDGKCDKRIDLNMNDEYSVEEFIMEFDD